jgi:hypothetical protein
VQSIQGQVLILEMCPQCGKPNVTETLICTYCGALLTDKTQLESTKTLGDTDFEDSEPKWGTARFNDRMNLVLRLADSGHRFVFDAESINELVIGRYDVSAQYSPEVDLQAHGASENGVSRRHASIIRRDGALHLVDLDTPNGTYLNGQKLIPHQARVLRDGDDIRLGRLVLQIAFVRVASGL